MIFARSYSAIMPCTWTRSWSSGEFFQEQDLMGVIAGQAIRTVNVELVDTTSGGQIAQLLEGGANQSGATIAIVHKLLLGQHAQSARSHGRAQLGDLASNRVGRTLLLRGYPGIDRHLKRLHADLLSPRGAPLGCAELDDTDVAVLRWREGGIKCR